MQHPDKPWSVPALSTPSRNGGSDEQAEDHAAAGRESRFHFASNAPGTSVVLAPDAPGLTRSASTLI
ncbi:MAG: hypothetical protein IT509_02300 [Rhodocyclaceae bacterium]|nr:hypothetical protein [Rhodocyclaceae bacterium]